MHFPHCAANARFASESVCSERVVWQLKANLHSLKVSRYGAKLLHGSNQVTFDLKTTIKIRKEKRSFGKRGDAGPS